MRALCLLLLMQTALLAHGQNELTLEDALDLTFQDNFGVSIQRNTSEIARNNNTSGNAGMLPILSLNSQKQWSQSNTDQEFLTGETQQVDNASAQSLNATAELSWTVFDGLSMFAAKDRLELQARAGRVRLRAQMEQTAADLIGAYYRLVQEKALLGVYQNTMDLSRSRLSLVKRQKQVGSSSELDVAQARNDRNQDSTRVIQQRNLIKNLHTDINLILGREPGTRFKAVTELHVNRNLELGPLRTSLDSLNSSLALARIQNRVAGVRVKEEKGRYYPALDVFGAYSYGKSRSEAGFLESNQDYGPAAGLRLRWDIFDGNNTRRRVANRIIEEENSQIRLRRASASAMGDLLSSYNDYEAALKALNLEETNVQEQQRILDVAVKRLEVGSLSNIEFREFQLSYTMAKNRKLTAQYEAKLAETQLLLNAGRLKVGE